jgi:hypothetical protein
LKYLLVQPYADDPHRFEYATVVSTHQTADAAFAALTRYAIRMKEQGTPRRTRSNCSWWTSSDGRFGDEIRLGVRLVETEMVDARSSSRDLSRSTLTSPI